MRKWLIVAATIFASSQTTAHAQKMDGELCLNDRDCRSSKCFPGPSDRLRNSDRNYCINRDLTCALPNQAGATRYSSVRTDNGNTYICMISGQGHRARFVRRIELKEKSDDGFACQMPSDCKSNYCSSHTSSAGALGFDVCMSPDRNCPIPGGKGIMYSGEFDFNGRHWICSNNENAHGLQSTIGETGYSFPGGNCSGFFEKIDCRGKWFPQLYRGISAFCSLPGNVAPDFCQVMRIVYDQYQRQRR